MNLPRLRVNLVQPHNVVPTYRIVGLRLHNLGTHRQPVLWSAAIEQTRRPVQFAFSSPAFRKQQRETSALLVCDGQNVGPTGQTSEVSSTSHGNSRVKILPKILSSDGLTFFGKRYSGNSRQHSFTTLFRNFPRQFLSRCHSHESWRT